MDVATLKAKIKSKQLPSAQPEITDGQAVEHLQASGWMQNHDKQMYEMGLRERLADDSDSYDALLSSAQPEIVRCKDCKFYTPMNRETKTGICRLLMHQNFGDDWYCAGAERRTDG